MTYLTHQNSRQDRQLFSSAAQIPLSKGFPQYKAKWNTIVRLALQQRRLRYESEADTMAERKANNEHDGERSEERNDEWERFDSFVKKLAAVPKEEVDEKRRKEEREKQAG